MNHRVSKSVLPYSLLGYALTLSHKHHSLTLSPKPGPSLTGGVDSLCEDHPSHTHAMTVNTISSLPSVLQPEENDITDLLVAEAHIGTRNSDDKMKPYIWKRRSDGIYILNVGKTWEKLVMAARIIAAVENPQDVIAISARPYGQRAVLKFASNTGCASIAGRCWSVFEM